MITSGTDPLGPTSFDNPAGGINLVVMDDFLFAEPTAVAAAAPEPTSLSLLGVAGVGMGLLAWRRGRRTLDELTSPEHSTSPIE